MLNQVVIIGRMTRDIELKKAANGREYGILTMAVTRSFKNMETNNYDTDFVDISLWGATAQNVAKYAGKGSALSIRGRVVNRLMEFPGEIKMRTVGIIGEQVSFVATKPPTRVNQSPQPATNKTQNNPNSVKTDDNSVLNELTESLTQSNQQMQDEGLTQPNETVILPVVSDSPVNTETVIETVSEFNIQDFPDPDAFQNKLAQETGHELQDNVENQ